MSYRDFVKMKKMKSPNNVKVGFLPGFSGVSAGDVLVDVNDMDLWHAENDAISVNVESDIYKFLKDTIPNLVEIAYTAIPIRKEN